MCDVAGLNRAIGCIVRAIVASRPHSMTAPLDGRPLGETLAVIDHYHPLSIIGGWFGRAGFVAARLFHRGFYVGRGIKPKE